MSPRLAFRILAAAGTALSLPATADEAPRFANIFADHAVLQRDRPIAVWGRAEPRRKVTVRLADRTVTATAAADGRWRATLPAMPAGGPYTLSVGEPSASAQTLADVMVGDVYLCGGQSNMEYPVKGSTDSFGTIRRSADADLRFVTIQDTSRAAPLDDLEVRADWKRVRPETVGEASAVCYYMARSLRQTQKVPIGFIASEWGGTRIESWISGRSLATRPPFREGVDAIALYERDQPRARAEEWARRDAWWARNDPASDEMRGFEAPGFDDSAWGTIPGGPWKQSGVSGLATFEGAMWLRTTVDLTAAQAASARTLRLGAIDQYDDTWINGRRVGSSSVNWYGRSYPVPTGTLHAGRNVIAIRVLGGNGPGGLSDEADRGFELVDGSTVPLPGTWRYKAGTAMTGKSIPSAPWDVPNSVTTLYNGMIAPVAGYGLKLAAWYQGESNASEAAEYRRLLPLLMADWRRSFDTPDLPFLVVQLTAFGKPVSAPAQSNWAELRAAQAQAVADDAHAGLAVTLDVGDRFDIHPTQKTVVGERLARLARVIAYGAPGYRSGPEAESVTRTGDDLVIRFRNVTDGLRLYGSGQAMGFETCAGEACTFAAAVVRDGGVTLAGGNRPDIDRIRYAWSDVPFVNLFDGADLPVAPFELPVR